MHWSQAFIPTLRDDPADAEAASHRLLVRAGFIRQLMAGAYSLLPLAMRTRDKIGRIIREEMNAIGAQEFLLPAIQPAEIWQKSGRLEIMGQEMFRLKDRKDADLALGMTHEEVFVSLALEMNSYRELPQLWYQIQTKFRDEPRPKAGVLRTREFTMKDSYSFDIDDAGLDKSFENHRRAYLRIFSRMGLDTIAIDASSGAMGGSGSIEFVIRSEAGEDLVVLCPTGDYAANVEKATSDLAPVEDPPGPPGPEPFDTPGIRTIAALAEFSPDAPPERQIKSLFYVIDGQLTIALVRGDHGLIEQKLVDATGGIDIRPAESDEIFDAMGAHPGSLGAVGIEGMTIVADHALAGRSNMTTGANIDDQHVRGVNVERDIRVTKWVDLREVEAGEACPACGTPLDVVKAIEVGHIFKLGRRFAEAFGATVLNNDGKPQTITMGSYGIGLERAMAAIAEAYHDESGLMWPVSVAPYELVVTVIGNDEPTLQRAEELYLAAQEQGIEVILDDRDERPGVKFADAELVGIPYRMVVGPRGLEKGVVEWKTRAGDGADIALEDAIAHAADSIEQAKAALL
ncbi:MAG: proline--tRNA ligase [Acidimicrobiia bacterium]|nr:proline--tRNA ligase [Acidimicrobiia bacterium]